MCVLLLQELLCVLTRPLVCVCICSGRQVQQTASKRFIDVTLELGGNVSASCRKEQKRIARHLH